MAGKLREMSREIRRHRRTPCWNLDLLPVAVFTATGEEERETNDQKLGANTHEYSKTEINRTSNLGYVTTAKTVSEAGFPITRDVLKSLKLYVLVHF